VFVRTAGEARCADVITAQPCNNHGLPPNSSVYQELQLRASFQCTNIGAIHIPNMSLRRQALDRRRHNITFGDERPQFAETGTKTKWLCEAVCLLQRVTYVHQLTAEIAVLVEQPVLPRFVLKFPACHGTGKFVKVFTTACHLSLPRTSQIQFTPS
jgi:hypothetical protein